MPLSAAEEQLVFEDALGPTERHRLLKLGFDILTNEKLLFRLLAFMRRAELRAVAMTMRFTEPICFIVAGYRKRCLYVCGGSTGRQPSTLVQRFHPSTGIWEELPALHQPRNLAAGASLLNAIYVCGGSDGKQYFSSAERFSLDTSTWESIPYMHAARSAAAAVSINGLLYVCGGRDNNSCLQSAECFDPRFDEWRVLTPMTHRCAYAAAVRLSHRVYIFGGIDQQGTTLKSVEYFDTKHKLPVGFWQPAPAMPEARAQAVGLTMNGFACLYGGSNGKEQLISVVRFNPSAGIWDSNLSMLSPRAFACAGVLQGCAYVFGGFNGTMFLKSGEYLDEKKRRWEEMLPLKQESCFAVTAVLEHYDSVSEGLASVDKRTISALEGLQSR